MVPEPDGTSFHFTVSEPSTDSTFTLSPPNPAWHLEVVAPDPDGSVYAVSETVPPGWELQAATCRSARGPVGSPGPAGVSSILMLPGQVTYCRFTDAPVPAPARLTIVKTTTPAGGSGFDFTTGVWTRSASRWTTGSHGSSTASPPAPTG